MPDPEKIVKQRKASQKGASGSGKPKQSYVSLQERLVTEHAYVENIEPRLSVKKYSQRSIKLLVQ